MPMKRTFPVAVLAAAILPGTACAQLYPGAKDAAGGGTWQGCGPSLQVAFSGTITDYLTYRFEPQVVAGSHTLYGLLWSVYDGQFHQSGEDTLVHTFPAPTEVVTCLTVEAFDLLAQQPCSTTTCDLFQALQDPSCADLVVDFGLSSVSGQTIGFADASVFPQTIASQVWSFGDGAMGWGPSPLHTYAGSGPYKVCLAVTGPPPLNCTATLCKWLYLGPAPVPCEVLFTPGFILVQSGNLVGVLDTSITSGMDRSVSWDFGDGSPVQTGRYAIHAYPGFGSYELCSTVRLWGPLLADTCSEVHCSTVDMPLLSTPEHTGAPALVVWPNPFADRLYAGPLVPGPFAATVFDAAGRVVHHTAGQTANGTLTLALNGLAAGCYSLAVQQPSGVRRVQVARE
jgi:PKD repeat protein